VDRVMDKLDDDGRAGLRRALDAERNAPDQDFVQAVGHDLHATIAHLTRNPVLELVALVLIRLAWMRPVNPSGRRPRELIDELTRTHERILEAIVSEDRELARHRGVAALHGLNAAHPQKVSPLLDTRLAVRVPVALRTSLVAGLSVSSSSWLGAAAR
jgi:DNA-binding GntR family transcriptional regulator